jgi:acyl-coenzyme A thioesterase PaaI-like protein
MNLDETPGELAARTQMAAALQHLGHALVGHRIDVDLADRVTAVAHDLTATVTGRPGRDRAAELAANTRFADLLAGRSRTSISVDGEPMDLFRDSIVSGRTNPMGIGLEVRRHGDAAIATTTLGTAFEGAPGRAHGGTIASILDETMGYVLPLIGVLAYTANLTIDYLAPAPLHRPLRFTARLRDRSERKLWIEAHGESDDGVFVRAEALFLAVDVTQFANSKRTDPGLSYPDAGPASVPSEVDRRSCRPYQPDGRRQR